jgi:hypothetical protein
MLDITTVSGILNQSDEGIQSPYNFQYDSARDLTVYKETKILGSTKEKEIRILAGDQTASLAARLEGRKTHLRKPDGSPYTQQDFLAIQEQQGESRARQIIQGGVDALLKETTLIFYIDQIFDTGFEAESGAGQVFPVLQYSPNYYTEQNNIDGHNAEIMSVARELARDLIVESVINLESKVAEKKIKTGLKLEMSERGLGIEKLGDVMKKHGYVVQLGGGEITCRKIIRPERDEKSSEQKRKWFPKLPGFSK